MKRFVIIGLTFGLLLFFAQSGIAAVGIGARSIGMGGAYSAVADDGTAAYWNPAGITQLELGFTPSFGASGDSSDILTFLSKLEKGERVTLPAGELAGSSSLGVGFNTSRFAVNLFADFDMAAFASESEGWLRLNGKGQGVITMAREFTSLLAVGANIKYVIVAEGTMSESLAGGGAYTTSYGSGSCLALDLGGMFRIGETIRLAAVVRDYTFGEITLKGEETTGVLVTTTTSWSRNEKIPAVLVLGGAVKIPLAGTLIAADLESPLEGDGESTLRIGVEQPILFDLLAVRAGGYKVGDGDFNFTAGAGCKLGPVLLDVAGVWEEGAVNGIVVTAGLRF